MSNWWLFHSSICVYMRVPRCEPPPWVCVSRLYATGRSGCVRDNISLHDSLSRVVDALLCETKACNGGSSPDAGPGPGPAARGPSLVLTVGFAHNTVDIWDVVLRPAAEAMAGWGRARAWLRGSCGCEDPSLLYCMQVHRANSERTRLRLACRVEQMRFFAHGVLLFAADSPSRPFRRRKAGCQ